MKRQATKHTLSGGKQRARTDDDRSERRAALIAAARQSLDHTPYDAIAMQALAARAGLSKAAAYTYFTSKEELFLALLAEELAAFFDGVNHDLSRVRKDAAAHVAKFVTGRLTQAPRLLALLALVHGRLETNVPHDAVLSFKRLLRDRVLDTGRRIDELLGVASGIGVLLLLRVHALAIGLGQMAAPAPLVEKAMASDPTLGFMQIDFRSAMQSALTDLLKGRGAT